MPFDDDFLQAELVYRRMVDALRERDLDALEELLAANVELRSYSTGLETVVGRQAALAAVRANAHVLYDPSLTRFDHLGGGWIILSARIRHSLVGGGIADSAKTLLVRVVGQRVRLSLVFNKASEARQEYEQRIRDDPS